MTKHAILLLLALLIPAAAPVRAQAVVSAEDREAIRGIPDRWGLTVGGFWQTFDTTARLDGETGQGTEIDFEKDLGTDSKATSFGLAGFYRFSGHHRLDFAYVPWSREHSKSIDRQIDWGDVVYDVGATITTKVKTQMLNAIYRYSFVNNGRVIFGLNAGISALWNDFSLTGEGTISGGPGVSGTITEGKNKVFPIPVIGLHLEATLTKTLFWRMEDNFFAASASGERGNVNEFAESFDYFPTKHFGFGVGFSSTVYTVEASGSRGGNFRIRDSFRGVTATLQFPF